MLAGWEVEGERWKGGGWRTKDERMNKAFRYPHVGTSVCLYGVFDSYVFSPNTNGEGIQYVVK